MTTAVSEAQAFVEQAIHSREHRVVVFAKSTCPYCQKAIGILRSMLGTGKVEVFNLDLLPLGEEIQRYLGHLTGASTVPRIFIDGQFLGGCDALEAQQASGELRSLLNSKGLLSEGVMGGAAAPTTYGTTGTAALTTYGTTGTTTTTTAPIPATGTYGTTATTGTHVPGMPVTSTEWVQTGHRYPHLHHQEKFTVTEDRPVTKEHIEQYVEHHPMEREFVHEVRTTGVERELGVERDMGPVKERVVGTTPSEYIEREV
jgi:glutaredoxin